jgi:hypothetical protein
MKNTKINFEQLKKLVTESIDINDNIFDQENILYGIITLAKDAVFYANEIHSNELNRQHHEEVYEDLIKKLIKNLEKLKTFDVVAL